MHAHRRQPHAQPNMRVKMTAQMTTEPPRPTKGSELTALPQIFAAPCLSTSEIIPSLRGPTSWQDSGPRRRCAAASIRSPQCPLCLALSSATCRPGAFAVKQLIGTIRLYRVNAFDAATLDYVNDHPSHDAVSKFPKVANSARYGLQRFDRAALDHELARKHTQRL